MQRQTTDAEMSGHGYHFPFEQRIFPLLNLLDKILEIITLRHLHEYSYYTFLSSVPLLC